MAHIYKSSAISGFIRELFDPGALKIISLETSPLQSIY